jgi:hypothetical protein
MPGRAHARTSSQLARGAAALLAACALVAYAAPAASADASACNVDTGRQLVQPADPNTNGIGVTRVFCGSFLGPGSQAMLVPFNPQCGCTGDIYMGWAVFGLFGGTWRPSTDGTHAIGLVNLTVSGTTITEERAIHRRTDMFPGTPTGGRQTRAWNWDGAVGLQAGEWVQSQPAEPQDTVAVIPRQTRRHSPLLFHPAGQPIVCQVEDDLRVFAYCEYRRSRITTARMSARGSVKTCRTRAHRHCQIANPSKGDATPALHTGKSVVVGRYRCRARQTGVECSIISTGRGFLIDRGQVHRAGV